LSFDALSVISRLNKLWSPFKIPFFLILPIVFSFKAHAFFYLGTICRFSWNCTYVSHWRFHDNRFMNTSAMFRNLKLYQFMLNVEFCLSRCSGAWTVACTWHFCPWTCSIKPSLQHFQFCRVGHSLGILFSLFYKRFLYMYKIIESDWLEIEFLNIGKCVHMTVIMEPSMCLFVPFYWKAA
jgi:hypothetical protein